MTGYPHLTPRFAATIGIAALLWTVAPAVAAESSGIPGQATAKTAHPVTKNDASRRTRIAAWRRDFRVHRVHSNLDCSDGWCGRQFVLMIGVAY
jgi:hypothetical protein